MLRHWSLWHCIFFIPLEYFQWFLLSYLLNIFLPLFRCLCFPENYLLTVFILIYLHDSVTPTYQQLSTTDFLSWTSNTYLPIAGTTYVDLPQTQNVLKVNQWSFFLNQCDFIYFHPELHVSSSSQSFKGDNESVPGLFVSSFVLLPIYFLGQYPSSHCYD